MSFNSLEKSRYSGKPIHFYLAQGAENSPDMGYIGPYGFNDGEEIFQFPWITDSAGDPVNFYPWPIKHSDPSSDGTLDKSDVTLTMSRGTPLDALFLAYPPSQVVNLTIFQGHVGDTVIQDNFKTIWMGRIISSAYKDSEMEFTGNPVSTNLKKPGLRRNYQLGCPHVLYGSQCGASKAAATITRTALSVSGNKVALTATVGTSYGDYAGGLLEWYHAVTGAKELRTISNITADGSTITIRGVMRGIVPGTLLSIIKGCNRLMSGCNMHANILNFGGQPFIPLENPLAQKNQFY